MALTPGTRLGPYEVLTQIGVGGMGEVYRATDTNLKRQQVAIKVLPASVAGDAERLASYDPPLSPRALRAASVASSIGIWASSFGRFAARLLTMTRSRGKTLTRRLTSIAPNQRSIS